MLSLEQMDAFIHDAQEPSRNEWETLKLKYKNKTATLYEQMQVGGHYRMEMVFKLLTQDFIEHNSEFYADTETALKELAKRISSMAGLDQDFTEFTMKDLIHRGYINMENSQEKTYFSWAHGD